MCRQNTRLRMFSKGMACAILMFLAVPATAAQNPVILKQETIPVAIDDVAGEVYVALPCDMWNKIFWGAWDVSNRDEVLISQPFADVFRVSQEEYGRIVQAFKEAWYGMDACEKHCAVTETKDGAQYLVDEAGLKEIAKTKHNVSRALAERVKSILGQERSDILDWLGPDVLRFPCELAYPGIPRVRDGRSIEIVTTRGKEGALTEVLRHPGDTEPSKLEVHHLKHPTLLTWPAMARRMGCTDEELTAVFEKYADRYQQGRHAIPDSIPVAGMDNQGNRFIFAPCTLIRDRDFRLALCQGGTLEWVSLSGDWRRLLRLDDASELAVVDLLLGMYDKFDNAFYEYSVAQTKTTTKVVVVISPQVSTELNNIVRETLDRVTEQAGKGTAKLLEPVLSKGALQTPEDIMPLAHLYSHIRSHERVAQLQDTLISVEKMDGRFYFKMETVDGAGTEGSIDRLDRQVPKFFWRFCPPEWKEFAPKGITPGNEERGPKATETLPAVKDVF